MTENAQQEEQPICTRETYWEELDDAGKITRLHRVAKEQQQIILEEFFTKRFALFYKQARKERLPRWIAVAWACFAVNELFIKPVKNPSLQNNNKGETELRWV